MTTGEQVNVLMVDDQPAKLISYEAILEDLGLHLIKATSAREALEQLLKTEVAVVLMDVSMPEIDGFELAEMIRQHPRHAKTAIIFISAVRRTDLDRLKGYEVGAVDYLPVPVIPEILRAKVNVFAELFRTTRQLEELNRDLERRVEERTAALVRALKVRDEFLSVAAHELKTPLTGLWANAQLMSRKVQKERVSPPSWFSEELSVINQQAERLNRLIGRLLDVSRLDQEKQSLDRAPTNLVVLAEKLVNAFRARTNKHTLVLTAEDEVIGEVDPMAIEQVISNMLDNAIKYSPMGGQIDIEVGRFGTEWTRLAVRDRGIGIPTEKRGEIFERFYQAHAQDHRSGLGLGLYITRQIVELHGGNVSVEFPDDGTRFVILLPMHGAPTAAPSPLMTVAAAVRK